MDEELMTFVSSLNFVNLNNDNTTKSSFGNLVT